jgi:hypothetical protein
MDTNSGARLSVVAYKAKPGKEADLIALVKQHVPDLRSISLATEREHIVATASNGTIIEVFEWVEGGLDRAHAHAGVGELWTRFAAVCDFVPLQTLDETAMMFANFVPVN